MSGNTKWEYLVQSLPVAPYTANKGTPDARTVSPESILNGLGAQGWEAFHIHEYVAYFKRPVTEAAGAAADDIVYDLRNSQEPV